MSDYISREEALESVREKLMICDALPDTIVKDASVFTLASMQHSLESIPAADVVPVAQGKWDDKPVAFFLKCSECGCCVGHRYDVFLDQGELNYCPNCGADMREES